MSAHVDRAGLKVAGTLARFVETRVLPGLAIEAEAFWAGAADIFARFAPENRALLAKRDALQMSIDAWCAADPRRAADPAAQEAFLREIGYLVPEPAPFTIGTENVDDEIARMAGPQLVVPALNARFVLNAANARWGSLYDALYGTDALPGTAKPGGYDSARGAQVIGFAKAFLDEAVPLAEGSWAGLTDAPVLRDPGQQVAPWLYRHNGLHIEVVIDRTHPIGRDDPAGIADVLLEAALTTIVDLEDSVAAVDAEDKVAAYANWLGLMQGDLEERFGKGGETVTRRLNADRGDLAGRSLLFIRNVGHLMTTPAVLLPDGEEAPEGILDAILTSLIALYDLRGLGTLRNSRAGSIYIVKPKMHGPEECGFTDRLFDAVEDLLGLARHTIKVGVMDEERRTSANLAACIHAVKDRIAFINTGFLDRTGDEIHTSMRAGPMIPKSEIKARAGSRPMRTATSASALPAGSRARRRSARGCGRRPIGWPTCSRRKARIRRRVRTPPGCRRRPRRRLHALHYHRTDVFARQRAIADEPVPGLAPLLTIPVALGRNWSPEEVQRELDNNAQGILGYVVRWIDQGVGCSKVPDIDDVGLMEDRATLRISSQHIANWLLHDVASEADVEAALWRMAAKVDAQNAGDPLYRPMAGREAESLAFAAAHALIFEGVVQPNGYTEPLLHRFRARAKAA
jgi:malate synthase